MFPSLAGTNHRDVRLRDSKQTSDFPLTERGGPDLFNFGGRELRHPVAGTVRSIASSLRKTIAHVVELSAEKQMCRIYARRIVATVKDEHPGRDLAMSEHPRVPMDGSQRSVQPGAAVSTRVTPAYPRPAIVNSAFQNTTPKLLDQCNLLGSHAGPPFPVVRGRKEFALRPVPIILAPVN